MINHRRFEIMNPEAQEIFDKILTTDPSNLTREQREFLRARSSYLKKAQVEEYAEVLEGSEPEITPTPEVQAAPPPFVPTEEKLSYNDLIKKAREMGYSGPRVSRGRLETFIKNAQ